MTSPKKWRRKGDWGTFTPGVNDGYANFDPAQTFVSPPEDRDVKTVEINKSGGAFGGVFTGVISGIAGALRGKGGATFKEIEVAYNESLGPINSSITELGKVHSELAGKVEGIITKQTEIVNTAVKQDQATKAAQQSASNAASDAVKALARVQIGPSLIAYRDLTDAEITAGKVDQDTPIWTTACNTVSTTIVPSGFRRSYGFYGKAENKSPDKKLVKVLPNQKYKLKFWAYGTGKLVIYLLDDKGAHSVKSSQEIIGRDENGVRQYGPNGKSTSGWLLSNFTFKGEQWNYHEFEVEFREGVEQVYFSTFFWNYQDTTTNRYQLFAGFDLSPDTPSQADVDDAQNRAIIALNKTDLEIIERQKLSTEFELEQVKVNELTQQQLWNHQNALEQLDIRSSKLYGWEIEDYHDFSVYPYYALGDNIANTNRGMRHWDTPYFELWADINLTPQKRAYLATKGSWEGSFRISINWTTGVIDDWVRPSNNNGRRVWAFLGGAGFIYMRHIAVAIHITSLCRKVLINLDEKGQAVYVDKENLVREKTQTRLRFRNTVTCSRAVPVEEYVTLPSGLIQRVTRLVPAGNRIDQPIMTDSMVYNSSYVFNELSDPSSQYNFDMPRPAYSQMNY